MKFHKIHHVAIIVSDYEKSRDFYVNKLDIFGIKGSPARLSYPEACGLRHLAFQVDNVERAVAELKEMGIEAEPIREDAFTGKKMTFFQDPDGLPLELHE